MTNISEKTFRAISCEGDTVASLTAYNATVFDAAKSNPRLAALVGEPLIQTMLEEYPGQISAVVFSNSRKEKYPRAINCAEGVCAINFDKHGIVTQIRRASQNGESSENDSLKKTYSSFFYNRESARILDVIHSGQPEKINTEMSKYTDERILRFMQDALSAKDTAAFFTLQCEMKKRDGYTPLDPETIMETKYIPMGDAEFSTVRMIFNFQSRRVVERSFGDGTRTIPFDDFDPETLTEMRQKLIELGGKPREISPQQKKPRPALGSSLGDALKS